MKNFLFAAGLFLCTGAFAQIPNAGFESWNFFETDTMPDAWHISDFGAGQTNDAYAGDHAVLVWNWYYYALGMAYLSADNTGALALAGGFISDYGVPVSVRPVSLKGYYKYIYGDNGGEADSAMVSISLRKYDADLHVKDSVGYALLKLPPAANYTAFTIPINYYSEFMPDTMVIALYSSSYGSMCDIESDGNCLYFYVDELALETPTGLVAVDDLINSKAYPVPVHDVLHLAVENDRNSVLRLYDNNGKTISAPFSSTAQEILLDVSQLPAGIYFYEMVNGEKIKASGRFVRE